MRPSWLQAVHDVLPEQAPRHVLRPLVLSHADPDLRGVKVLIFADDDAEPRWMLRCHGNPAVTSREGKVLGELQRLGFKLQPPLLGQTSCEDMHGLLLGFCSGQRAGADVWMAPAPINTLMSELARVQMSLADWSHSTFPPQRIETGELHAVTQQVSEDTIDPVRFAAAVDHARQALVSAGAPQLPQHGDFWTSNVLWSSGEVKLIDWEQFGFVFDPFMDVWTFMVSVCDDLRDPEWASLFGAGPATAATDRAVRQYASGIGVPAWVGRDAFPLAIARFIHYNALHKRTWIAGRMARLLRVYLQDPSRFMPGLVPA